MLKFYIFSLDTAFLGHMMSQIIATLLPLLNSLPKQVAELFNFMIVENRYVIGTHDVTYYSDSPSFVKLTCGRVV